VKPGDLVVAKKNPQSIGIVVEVFDDLSSDNPWIRVLFTYPHEIYQWCKLEGLQLANEAQLKRKGQNDPPSKDAIPRTGSL